MQALGAFQKKVKVKRLKRYNKYLTSFHVVNTLVPPQNLPILLEKVFQEQAQVGCGGCLVPSSNGLIVAAAPTHVFVDFADDFVDLVLSTKGIEQICEFFEAIIYRRTPEKLLRHQQASGCPRLSYAQMESMP